MTQNPKMLAGSTIAFWSFGMSLARLMSLKSQFVLVSLSFSFSFITLLLYFILTQRGALWAGLRSITPRYFIFGACGYWVYWLGLTQSLRAFNSASATTILNYTWPMFTVISTTLFFSARAPKSTPVRRIEGLGIGLGFLAVVILATQGRLTVDLLNARGIGWGLLAGFAYGLFGAYSSTVPGEQHSIFLLCAVFISLVGMLLLSTSELALVKSITRKDILVTFATGCLLDGIGYITWTRANRLAREQTISIAAVASLMYVLPLLSLTLVAMFFGEKQLFQAYFALSLLLIVVGSLLCQKAESIGAHITGNSPSPCNGEEAGG